MKPSPVLNLLAGFLERDKYTLKEIVAQHLFEDLSLDELAALAGMSTPSFKRKFKQNLGESPGQYIKNKRLEHAAELLKSTLDSVADIAYACGFSDPNYFSKVFRQQYEHSPLEYRKMMGSI